MASNFSSPPRTPVYEAQSISVPLILLLRLECLEAFIFPFPSRLSTQRQKDELKSARHTQRIYLEMTVR